MWVAMYIDIVPNRNSPPAVLLRESYREGKKVLKRTIANLSEVPRNIVEGLRILLRGGAAVEHFEDSFEIERSLPHGHVAAVLGTLRKLKLDTLIDSEPSEERNRVVAMIVARILDPRSKLATARGLDEETSTSTLAEILEVQKTDAQALYTAMDWLGERQAEIEKKLAKRHLEDGALVLYDVSSTYFEGKCCPLGQLGHSRDEKRGKLQIVFGLLCNRAGCPVAVEVFDGNTADPKTLGAQIEKLRHRFKLSCVVLVGDRDMITEARIRDEIKPIEGLDWITALRAPAIRPLVETGKLQLSFFDERDLAEIQSPDYPGERLIVCKNPLMAVRRAKKRQALLEATEHELNKIVAATKRPVRPLKGEAPIGLRVGKVLHRFKMAKHFRLDIREAGFSYARDEVKIAEEAALDGIYVVRTNRDYMDVMLWGGTGRTCKRQRSTPKRRCVPTKTSATLSRRFAATRPSISRSAPSTITWSIGCVPTSFSACLPITSSGICAKPSHHCCSTMTTRPPPRRNATPPSYPSSLRRAHKTRPAPYARRMASPYTASRPCSPISPRSPRTASGPNCPELTASIRSPAPPPCSGRHSISWA
jgi:hypothetical protein